jgi:hypothetical protein
VEVVARGHLPRRTRLDARNCATDQSQSVRVGGQGRHILNGQIAFADLWPLNRICGFLESLAAFTVLCILFALAYVFEV